MTELEQFLIDHGLAGTDRVTVSCGNHLVEVSAIQLYRAIHASKDRKDNADRALAIMSIAREIEQPSEAIRMLIHATAGIVCNVETVGSDADKMLGEYLTETIAHIRARMAAVAAARTK